MPNDDARESIRAYLQHVAEVEVGTILSPGSRQIVGYCAEWVRNRLDEQWLRDQAKPFAGQEEAESSHELQSPTGELARLRAKLTSARAALDRLITAIEHGYGEGEGEEFELEGLIDAVSIHDDLENIRALLAPDLQKEPLRVNTAEAKLDAVHKEVALWETYAEEPEDSHKSMRRIVQILLGTPNPSMGG